MLLLPAPDPSRHLSHHIPHHLPPVQPQGNSQHIMEDTRLTDGSNLLQRYRRGTGGTGS